MRRKLPGPSRHSATGKAAGGRPVIRRIIWIHERLGNDHRVNASTLARECEVSPRTVKRDIEYMRDQLGAPIEWDRATNSYCYSRPCDILPLLRLSADEALALVLAGETFSAWRGTPLGRALTAALDKIAGVVGGAISLPASEITSLVYQPHVSPELDAERKWLAIALEAIRRHRELRLVYQKPREKKPEERTVQPLHLAFLDHQWMLIAHDPQRRARRNFLLTRIRDARVTGRQFEPPPGFDAKTHLRGSLGRFTGDEEITVRIAFDSVVAPYLRERPWHPSQSITDRPDGGLNVTLQLNNLIDVRRWILACGAHAEVLEPPELRQEIGEEIQRMSVRYDHH